MYINSPNEPADMELNSTSTETVPAPLLIENGNVVPDED